MKNKILLTGSEGLIGGIIKPNLEKEYELYCLDIKDKNDHNYFKIDISKIEQLENSFDKIPKMDIIIHLAADPRPNAPWESILNKNIIGTKNVYEIAHKYGVNKVIFASSNHVTGAYEGFPPGLCNTIKIRYNSGINIKIKSYAAKNFTNCS